jgi:hypothetical protein
LRRDPLARLPFCRWPAKQGLEFPDIMIYNHGNDNSIQEPTEAPRTKTPLERIESMGEKKQYKAPEVRSEQIAIGVFGDYGTTGDGGNNHVSPLNFWNPLFRICCS